MKFRKPCQYCGEEFLPAGLAQHEKFCASRPDHQEIVKKHRSLFNKLSKTKTEDLGDIETIYKIFPDDAALFSAVNHLLLAYGGVDRLTNLVAARTMIELKINSLE